MEWQQNVLATLSDDAPTQIPSDFGFHHDTQTVQYAHIGLFVFHVVPSVFLNEDAYLINDVIKYHNLKDAVRDSDQEFHAPDSYEEQDIDDEIKSITL